MKLSELPGPIKPYEYYLYYLCEKLGGEVAPILEVVKAIEQEENESDITTTN